MHFFPNLLKEFKLWVSEDAFGKPQEMARVAPAYCLKKSVLRNNLNPQSRNQALLHDPSNSSVVIWLQYRRLNGSKRWKQCSLEWKYATLKTTASVHVLSSLENVLCRKTKYIQKRVKCNRGEKATKHTLTVMCLLLTAPQCRNTKNMPIFPNPTSLNFDK